RWAVTPPSRLPPAVATSSSMPSFMLMRCLPARPADTVLDVAMTVVRLIAAATLNGRPSPRFRKGTRNTTPPRPSTAPKTPEAVPAPKMINASVAVTAVIEAQLGRTGAAARTRSASSLHDPDACQGVALFQRRNRANEQDGSLVGGGDLLQRAIQVIGDDPDPRPFGDVGIAIDGRMEHPVAVGRQRHDFLDPHPAADGS